MWKWCSSCVPVLCIFPVSMLSLYQHKLMLLALVVSAEMLYMSGTYAYEATTESSFTSLWVKIPPVCRSAALLSFEVPPSSEVFASP